MPLPKDPVRAAELKVEQKLHALLLYALNVGIEARRAASKKMWENPKHRKNLITLITQRERDRWKTYRHPAETVKGIHLKRKTTLFASYGFNIQYVLEMEVKGYKYCKYHKQFISKDNFTIELQINSCNFCEAIRAHNVSFELFSEKIKEQLGCCAICKKQLLSKICLDHDHNCCARAFSCGKCIRGLICSYCNIATRFVENIALSCKIYKYLDLHESTEQLNKLVEILSN